MISAGFLCMGIIAALAAAQDPINQHQYLTDRWLMKSSVLVPEDGAQISTLDYKPQGWFKTSVPTTVLNALVKNGVYPDPRIGLNSFRIPDASDEFNRDNDLARFSYLPDQRNPWRDPYWFRTEFTVPSKVPDQHLWLNFKGINYRAEVWLNGNRIASKDEMAGIYLRFRFDVTGQAREGKNVLAVKVFPVDHPGLPDTQLEPLGKNRNFQKDIQKDVTV